MLETGINPTFLERPFDECLGDILTGRPVSLGKASSPESCHKVEVPPRFIFAYIDSIAHNTAKFLASITHADSGKNETSSEEQHKPWVPVHRPVPMAGRANGLVRRHGPRRERACPSKPPGR